MFQLSLIIVKSIRVSINSMMMWAFWNTPIIGSFYFKDNSVYLPFSMRNLYTFHDYQNYKYILQLELLEFSSIFCFIYENNAIRVSKTLIWRHLYGGALRWPSWISIILTYVVDDIQQYVHFSPFSQGALEHGNSVKRFQ